MSKDKVPAILFATHDGIIAVWPNPEGPLAHMFEEVDVEVNGRWYKRPKVWVFRFAIMLGDYFDRVHGLKADWDVLKRLMRLAGITYEQVQGAYVPCGRSYDWYPGPKGAEHRGEYGWYESDARQLRQHDTPLTIFRG